MSIEIIHGYTIDTAKLSTHSTVIVAGLSEHLLLEQELVKRGVDVIGFEINEQILQEAKAICRTNPSFNKHFDISIRLLTPAFEPSKRVFVDDDNKPISTMVNHEGVNPNNCLLYPTVAFPSIVKKFGRVSLVVLDMHGEEYKLAKCIDPKCQIFIRFYQKALGYTEIQTDRMLLALKKKGYAVASIAPMLNGCVDVLLIHV